jgi:hypothetical protein
MSEERNLWAQIKRNTKGVVWTRIESNTGLGIPDLFGFYKRPFWGQRPSSEDHQIILRLHCP